MVQQQYMSQVQLSQSLLSHPIPNIKNLIQLYFVYISQIISSQIIEEWVNLPVTELSSGLLQSLVSDNTYFDFFGTLLYVLFWEFEESRLVFIASLFPAC